MDVYLYDVCVCRSYIMSFVIVYLMLVCGGHNKIGICYINILIEITISICVNSVIEYVN